MVHGQAAPWRVGWQWRLLCEGAAIRMEGAPVIILGCRAAQFVRDGGQGADARIVHVREILTPPVRRCPVEGSIAANFNDHLEHTVPLCPGERWLRTAAPVFPL
jgi:hypothetical protein